MAQIPKQSSYKVTTQAICSYYARNQQSSGDTLQEQVYVNLCNAKSKNKTQTNLENIALYVCGEQWRQRWETLKEEVQGHVSLLWHPRASSGRLLPEDGSSGSMRQPSFFGT